MIVTHVNVEVSLFPYSMKETKYVIIVAFKKNILLNKSQIIIKIHQKKCVFMHIKELIILREILAQFQAKETTTNTT